MSIFFPEKPRVPLTSELKDVVRLLDELSECDLTDWETEFVESLLARIEKYEGEAFISDAQGDWLNRLAEKYHLDPS